jgi:multiple RNA-binding domain-containing protein 1
VCVQEGVNVSNITNTGRRSRSIILVKNIPFGTSSATLRALFAPHGTVDKVLVPPTGTMAVIKMTNEAEAKVAFRSLAYRPIGSSVMYLEWAPESMVIAEPKPGATTPAKPAEADQGEEGDEDDDSEERREAGSTLYVKNLSFATTSARLASAFDSLNSFMFARVQTKPDPKKPGGTLSMGYGFVGFRTADAAQRAQKAMGGFNLDGHALQVKFAQSHERTDPAESTEAGKGKKSKSTKLIVKNVPFEATKRELRQLFGYVVRFAHGMGGDIFGLTFPHGSSQQLRPIEVCPATAEIRQHDEGFRLSRICLSSRGGECIREPAAYSFPRTPPGGSVE